MKKEPEKAKEEPSSMFQRQRVDMLLGELMRKFPLPMMVNPNVAPVAATDQSAPQRPDLKEANANNATTNTSNANSNNQNGEFKPPEKRAKP